MKRQRNTTQVKEQTRNTKVQINEKEIGNYLKKNSIIMKKQRNTTQIKEQTRNTEIQINEEEIGKLPEKEFRIMIIKIIKTLENKMEKMKESINKDLE